MGIDPVTHAPRLDLLDLSSILSSTLCNQSILNMSNLLGTQALMNPELLRLATTILSLKQESQVPFPQNLQENQLCNFLLQNQVQPLQPNQYQAPIQEGFSSESNQLMQANVEGFLSKVATFGNSQENSIASNLNEDFFCQPNDTYCSSNPIAPDLAENSNFQSLYNSYQNFSFDSVVSTPKSSPTPLNSSSTFINSSTEDDRDSHCSNLLKFEIPESLDIDEFMSI